MESKMPKQKKPFIISRVILPKNPGEKQVIVEVRRQIRSARKPKLSYSVFYGKQLKTFDVILEKQDEDKDLYRGIFIVKAKYSLPFFISHAIDRPKKNVTLILSLSHKPLNKYVALEKSHHFFELPRKLRIALMGDSYAAGLGSGKYDLSDPKKEPAAFRSSRSGGELLMAELKKRYRISYLDVTYSGAQLMGGNESSHKAKKKLKSSLLFDHDDGEGVVAGEQFKQLLAWTGNKKVDYIIMAIGGNDMYENNNGYSGLDQLIKYAVKKDLTKEKKKEKFISRITTGLDSLKESFVKLNIFLGEHQNLMDSKLLLSSYPDLTKDENGHYKEAYSETYTITKEEMKIIYNELFEPLNQEIEAACTLNSWSFNNVMLNNTHIITHGLPSNDSWFHQLDRYGNGSDRKNEPGNRVSLHPTREGHYQIYYKTLRKVLKRNLPL